MENQSEEPDMTFTKELRAATKDVHKISDVLVNAKFALALSDDGVWADGLLSFYEIYKFLENNLSEDLLPSELRRTASFEKDFIFFFGEDWKKTYVVRPSVVKYLDHLEEVAKKNNLLLFAYAFQMYMALMSGGQLLQRKRMIARKLWLEKAEENEDIKDEQEKPLKTDDLQSRPMPKQVKIAPPGCSATFFPQPIPVLKAKLRNILNSYYKDFDDEMKAEFIQESRNVFIYNGDVVRSVKGVNRANIKKVSFILGFVMVAYLAIRLAIIPHLASN